ncbi:MAG: hypothetical protein WD646_12810 [Actinomycetota bacterium]
MTRATRTGLQTPASRVEKVLPRQLVVEPATLEIGAAIDEGVPPDRSVRYNARWSQRGAAGSARVEIRPTSKVTTDIVVELSRATGPWALLWSKPRRYRLASLFAQALGYHAETRSGEDAHGFEVRRTTPELVRARSA